MVVRRQNYLRSTFEDYAKQVFHENELKFIGQRIRYIPMDFKNREDWTEEEKGDIFKK